MSLSCLCSLKSELHDWLSMYQSSMKKQKNIVPVFEQYIFFFSAANHNVLALVAKKFSEWCHERRSYFWAPGHTLSPDVSDLSKNSLDLQSY